MVWLLRQGAHVLDADVEKMVGIVGRVGEAPAAAAHAIDQRNIEAPHCLARQVDGEQGAAEARPDDGDRRRVHDAARKPARALHLPRRSSAASSVSRLLAKQNRMWLLTSRSP